MKYQVLVYILLFLSIFSLPIALFASENLSEKLSGRILLQVEENGEAWYVLPDNKMRYFLGRPEDAFSIMREQGIGITNANLNKIPVGFIEYTKSDPGYPRSDFPNDFDSDGLSNNLEIALGTDINKKDSDDDGFDDKNELENGFDPAGPEVMPIDIIFSSKQKGKIFLQVESHGEAWYVNPVNSKRYFLGRPDDAFAVMRFLGLGIKNIDLNKILARTPGFLLAEAEKKLHNLINQERTNNNKTALVWNNELATVAREHGRNLAEENKAFTDFGIVCDYPLIHHEGLSFGIYNGDRLGNRGIYYYSKTGENIALVSGATYKVIYRAGDTTEIELSACEAKRDKWDTDFSDTLDNTKDEEVKITLVRVEVEKRGSEFSKQNKINASETAWRLEDIILAEIVEGWMNSPGHRKNILEGDYSEAGMGFTYINGYFIATQVFIKRAECGFKEGPCCEKKGYYPYCFVPLECEEMVCGA